MVTVWAAFWGLAGGTCVEALELYAQIRRNRKWTWSSSVPQGLSAYLLSVLIRAGVGAVVATAAAESDQISGAFGALALGAAAPMVIERLARGVPLAEAVRTTGARAYPVATSCAEPPAEPRTGASEPETPPALGIARAERRDEHEAGAAEPDTPQAFGSAQHESRPVDRPWVPDTMYGSPRDTVPPTGVAGRPEARPSRAGFGSLLIAALARRDSVPVVRGRG